MKTSHDTNWKAAIHKLPGKLSSNVSNVSFVCPVCPVCRSLPKANYELMTQSVCEICRYTAALAAKNIIRANSFFNGRIDVLVNNAGVSPVLPFDTVMKVCGCEIGLVGYFFPLIGLQTNHYQTTRWTSTESYSERGCLQRSKALKVGGPKNSQ